MIFLLYPIIVGFACGIYYNIFLYCCVLSNKKSPNYLYFIFLTLFTWMGAKIFFLLLSSYKTNDLILYPLFWLTGGLVFYGGLLFALIFNFMFFKIFKYNYFKELIISCVFGHALGRLGCFFGGCCYGIKMDFLYFSRVPVQLIESVYLLILGIYLFRNLLNKNYLEITSLYLVLYAFFRFIIEFFRGDEVRGIYNGLSSSQWISIGVFIFGLTLHLLREHKGGS